MPLNIANPPDAAIIVFRQARISRSGRRQTMEDTTMSHDISLYQMAFQVEADLQSSHLERVRQAQQAHSERCTTPLLPRILTLLAAIPTWLSDRAPCKPLGWTGEPGARAGYAVPAAPSEPLD